MHALQTRAMYTCHVDIHTVAAVDAREEKLGAGEASAVGDALEFVDLSCMHIHMSYMH